MLTKVTIEFDNAREAALATKIASIAQAIFELQEWPKSEKVFSSYNNSEHYFLGISSAINRLTSLLEYCIGKDSTKELLELGNYLGNAEKTNDSQ